jgi:hypothetical protein
MKTGQRGALNLKKLSVNFVWASFSQEWTRDRSYPLVFSFQMNRDLSVTMHEDMHLFVVTHHFVKLQQLEVARVVISTHYIVQSLTR